MLGCRWPGWKWIASWKNEATFFKFIASVSENTLQFWLWFIFSCKFTWYLRALILKISVLGCRWPGWKWIVSWKNEATFFKFIASVSENSLKFSLWFIFSCKFTWYLPFSVPSVFCVRQRYVVLIWGHFDPKT